MDRQETERRIAELAHRAVVLRQNPAPAEAEERRRQADQHDREAAALRVALDDHLRAERATLEAARNADLVMVRFVRDLPSDCLVGNVTVAAAHGPVRQRQARPVAGSHPLAGEGVEVTLAPGEARELPGHVAQVLLEGGYVRVLTTTTEVARARAELEG